MSTTPSLKCGLREDRRVFYRVVLRRSQASRLDHQCTSTAYCTSIIRRDEIKAYETTHAETRGQTDTRTTDIGRGRIDSLEPKCRRRPKGHTSKTVVTRSGRILQHTAPTPAVQLRRLMTFCLSAPCTSTLTYLLTSVLNPRTGNDVNTTFCQDQDQDFSCSDKWFSITWLNTIADLVA